MPENTTKDNSREVHTARGQYLLQEKIAQGGMAEIFKGIAEDIYGMKRTVVIKKILPHIAANKEFVDMLVGEAKIAVQLSHGNIAQIYDLGKIGNDYFMVMEFVDGKSLSLINKQCIKNGELVPLEYACYFISEVANGLDYMHKKTDQAGKPLGIVHRDISPQNIIVSFSGTVKIIDFGIAKAASTIDATESGVLKGKFAYMSPEQARGEKIDGRSDIFSLGIILYELLCGKRLFKEKDNKATIRNVRRADVVPPSTLNPEVPEELDHIVMKALAKDPERRYQHAFEMSDELVKFLHKQFPEFLSASVHDFIIDTFGDEISITEEEKEHTPLLIIDQTSSAIQMDPVGDETADAPSLTLPIKGRENISETMEHPPLDEHGNMERESPDEPETFCQRQNMQRSDLKRSAEQAEHTTFRLETFYRQVKQATFRLETFYRKVKPFALSLTLIASVSFIIFTGAKFGLWQKWYAFFKPVNMNEVNDPELVIVKFTTLAVDSKPSGATVFIDDIETRFKTPITITDIKADGKPHKIGIFLAGHKYFNATFTARPDDTIRFSPNLNIAYGALKIISEPSDAIVTINGEPAGRTPFTKSEILPDSILKIHVEKEGYSPFDTEVKISQNMETSLRPNLMRLPRNKKPETTGTSGTIGTHGTSETSETPIQTEPPKQPPETPIDIPLLPAEPVAPSQKPVEEPAEKDSPQSPEGTHGDTSPQSPGGTLPAGKRPIPLELDYNK